ncbi:MAG TPA: ABC transporter permease [Thermomicrobiales bacterium]|jgi:peptide/nickel transport system permease protein|nr:ABC transporter permease [Thermomicrobiales bacterium]
MNLFQFTLRRLLMMIPVLFGVSVLTFVLSRVVPGDPARLAAGPQATESTYLQIREEFGLDDPLPFQYWTYIRNLFAGDWGTSITTRRPVLDDLTVFWPATLELVLVAMTIAVAVGLPLGIIAAVRADSIADQASRLISMLGVAVPAFWLALLMQLFFGLELGWFPISGRLSALTSPPDSITRLYLVDSLLTGQWSTFREAVSHIVLPALTLSLASIATIARFTRASLLETLGQDYVRTARAKGLSERRVITRHALRNAFIPTLTMIGLSFGWSMGGSVLVETIFDWPGIGLYATNAALTLDFLPILGIALLYGLVFSLINIAVDITYGFLDPRANTT